MSIVMQINPFEFFADTQGDPLDAGYVWIGQPNLDPRQYPAIAYFDEALTIPAAMPLRTSNGYIVRAGTPAILYINGNYSVLVQDSRGRQMFYVPDFLMIGAGQAINAGDLANNTDDTKGAALVGYFQDGQGAVGRTALDKLREPVSAEDFGAIGATGFPAYHPLSERFASLALAQASYPFATSLTQSIDWAAIQAAMNFLEPTGGVVKGTRQFYTVTDELQFPDSVTFEGEGVGAWDTVFPNRAKTWGGTNIVAYGTGAKTYARRGITSMYVAGGHRLISGVDYANLSSLMNADAAGSTAASPKQLSVAVRGKQRLSRHWGLKNVRVVPWIGTDGISEYSNQAYTGIADDWNIGILMEDSEYVTLENVQSVGYWRNYGCILANSDYDEFGGQERNQIIQCKFQGVRGLAMRSGDTRSVVAKTATTVEILWDAEVFWQPNGSFTALPDSGFTVYNYTTLSRNGDNLVFNGVSPDPTTLNITQIRAPKRSTGAAGTKFKDTFVSGLDHTNGGQSSAYGLGDSTAFEMSGFPMRGVSFDNFKIQSREKGLYFFHDCQDVLMDQCQAEGSGFRVASPVASASTAPSPVGDTRNFRAHSSLGFAPTALFTPRSIYNDIDQMSGNPLVSNLDIRPFFADPITLSSRTNGEVMRITDDSLVGIGTTAPVQKLHVATTLPEMARLERTGSTGLVGVQYRNTNGIVSIRVQPSADNAGTFFSSGDNTVSCGTASFRWSTVFAGTGTINTSDGNMKKIRGLMNEAEMRAWARVNQKVFQMIDAVNEKGEAYARLHAGYIAQEVFDSFAAEGLDASKYALWCEDAHYKTTIVNQPVLRQKTTTKPKTETSIEIRDGVPVRIVTTTDVKVGEYEQVAVLEEDGSLATDDDGNQIYASVPVMEEVLEDVEVQEPDGVRLGLRYGDCYAFETAYLRTLAHNHDLRISALEGGA